MIEGQKVDFEIRGMMDFEGCTWCFDGYSLELLFGVMGWR